MRPPEWLAVGHLLLLDGRNPRSAAFQLATLGRHVRLLPGADLADLVGELAEVSAACRAAETAAAEVLIRPGALGRFLARAEDLALRLSDALTLRHFSHVAEPAQATAVL
jgi:uncharacterized alpha-E superfamily protein